MGLNDAFATVDGVTAQPILDMGDMSQITVANGETFTIRDGQGRILLEIVGPDVVMGPLVLS